MQHLFHRFLSRWLLLGVCIAVVCLPGTHTAAAQQDAMHPHNGADLLRAPTAPHYTLVGSVDVAAHAVAMRQTVDWYNDTGTTVSALPFRLFANLSDFAGQTTIDTAHIEGLPVRIALSHRDSIVTLTPARPIAPGDTARITLTYRTRVPVDHGQDKYGAFNDDGVTLSFASAYPLLTDFRDGRWLTDIPDTKGDLVNSSMATYDVTLTLPRTHRLVSTGSTLGISATEQTHTYTVASGLQRDFAFAVTALPVVSTQVDGTRINVYAAAAPDVERMQTLDAAAQTLRLFNTRYGRYPYAELDLVAVDAGSFYGVEYPGFILLQDTLLTSTPRRIATIVAHEVAHQWFYNLVGNDVQRDAWVDEALATYAQVIYWRAYEGEASAAAELEDFQRQYDRIVERGRDGPVAQDMWTYTLYSFNVLAYAKGALFYDAVSQQLGKETFDRALRAYVQQYQYRIADGTSFARVADQICACSIDPLVETWIHSPVKESAP